MNTHETDRAVTAPAPGGITRRALLQRSAAIGGGVLAAQTLGVVTAHAQTSAPPPNPSEGPSEVTTPPSEAPSETETTPPSEAPSETETETTPPREVAGETETTPPSETATTPPRTTGGSTSGAPPTTATTGQPRATAQSLVTQAADRLPHTGAAVPTMVAAAASAVAAGTALVRRGAATSPVADGTTDTAGADDA